MEVIENKYLKITINKIGGTLVSIVDKTRDNFELMYQIRKDSWEYQDVQMFPLIGNGEYSFKEKDYKIPTRHGFIRNLTFDILTRKKNQLVLVLKSDEETKKVYPFEFEFKIKYKLVKNKLIVTTKVNADKKTCYSYGSHTAMKICEKANVIFSNYINQFELDNDLINLEKTLIKKEIYLQNPSDFEKNHTIVLENKSKNVCLNNGLGYEIKYQFSSPLFAVWIKPTTLDFVCIEPWWGISNYKNESKNLDDRLYINKGNNTFKYSLSFSYIG